eukprot:1891795-Pleurochrysis_carterae.AAC.1
MSHLSFVQMLNPSESARARARSCMRAWEIMRLRAPARLRIHAHAQQECSHNSSYRMSRHTAPDFELFSQ